MLLSCPFPLISHYCNGDWKVTLVWGQHVLNRHDWDRAMMLEWQYRLLSSETGVNSGPDLVVECWQQGGFAMVSLLISFTFNVPWEWVFTNGNCHQFLVLTLLTLLPLVPPFEKKLNSWACIDWVASQDCKGRAHVNSDHICTGRTIDAKMGQGSAADHGSF